MKCRIFVAMLCVLLFLVSCGTGRAPSALPDGELPQTPVDYQTMDKRPSIAPRSGVVKIGVSLQGIERPFIRQLQMRLLQLEFTYNGAVDLTIMDGKEDPERQNAQIEEFIMNEMDAIIFNAFSYSEGALGVELARQQEIPIVLLTGLVENAYDAQALAVSDHRESAWLQMDMVARHLEHGGNIAILRGPNEIDAAIQRTTGYQEKLAEYPELHVTVEQIANWSEEEAYAIVENWIRLGKPIDAIVAQNDNMAYGAVRAVEEADVQNEIVVFGIDGDLEALELIQEGRMAGTVYHDAVMQTALALQYAIDLAEGKTVTSELVPFWIVEQQNVDDFLSLYQESAKEDSGQEIATTS